MVKKYIYWSSVKYPLFCQILMKIEFSRHGFEKYSNINFRGNWGGGGELFHADRQKNSRTGTLDKANTRFGQFRERA